MTFALHSRLQADTLQVADLPLCCVRLMNDSRFPWLILVPRGPDLREIFDLSAAERAILMEEIAMSAKILRDMTGAAKMNIGAIGNIVPQLHVHVVARVETDAAWPAPVWGQGSPELYAGAAATCLVASVAGALSSSLCSRPDP